MSIEKRAAIINAAREMSKKYGVVNLTKKNVCQLAGVPVGSFQLIMGSTFSDLCLDLPEDPAEVLITKKRIYPEQRRRHLKGVALRLARTHGFQNITREQIAAAAECSPGLVSKYLGSMPTLRDYVIEHAILMLDADVLAQGLIAKHPTALAAPAELKTKAVQTIITL